MLLKFSLPVMPCVLLPSAALHGVVGDRASAAAGNPSAADTDLTQVQCQVLNASRFTPTSA